MPTCWATGSGRPKRSEAALTLATVRRPGSIGDREPAQAQQSPGEHLRLERRERVLAWEHVTRRSHGESGRLEQLRHFRTCPLADVVQVLRWAQRRLVVQTVAIRGGEDQRPVVAEQIAQPSQEMNRVVDVLDHVGADRETGPQLREVGPQVFGAQVVLDPFVRRELLAGDRDGTRLVDADRPLDPAPQTLHQVHAGAAADIEDQVRGSGHPARGEAVHRVLVAAARPGADLRVVRPVVEPVFGADRFRLVLAVALGQEELVPIHDNGALARVSPRSSGSTRVVSVPVGRAGRL